MDLAQYVQLGLVLAGITELLSRLRARDLWVATTIASCVVVGGLCGALELFGVPTVEVGVLVGFATSGALKGISMFGNKSTPTPSAPLDLAK